MDRCNIFSLSALTALGFVFGLPAKADLISDWNTKAEVIQIEKQLASQTSARALSILHVAMFEAVSAIDRRYGAYKLSMAPEPNASKEAAAASAAHAVLSAIYPDQQQKLDAALAESLAKINEGDSKAKGIDLGKRAAAGIIALRANDGTAVAETYRPFTNAGVYVPTTIPVFSTWGASTPWVMTTGSQFRPEPPPALNSTTWANDVNEVRQLGGRNSSIRTAEQTNIGRFWFFTGPQTWNPILRQVAAAKDLNLLDSARLFALVNMAGNDAYVAVMDAKYAFNLWRPITAIRNADLSKNKATPSEASWLALGETPLHPEYPCAHCIASTAAGTVIKNVVGNDVAEITLTSPTAPGVTRKWTRIQDYIDEVSMARIYAGFHYRFSTKVGEDMGRKIAELTLATQLLRTAEARR